MKKTKETKPNIILLTVDCLRADHLGCIGYKRDTTPLMDSLAKNGVLFNKAYSNATHTTASVSSFLTGTYPLYNGNVIIKDRPTIAELLKKNGYNTTAFHSNAILSQNPENYRKGFDVFEDVFSENIESEKSIISKLMYKFESDAGWSIVRKIASIFGNKSLTIRYYLSKAYLSVRKNPNSPYASADEVNSKAISWLEKSSAPFFMWLHYMDVHSPYSPPKAFYNDLSRGKHGLGDGMLISLKASDGYYRLQELEKEILNDLYDASIKYVDHAINNLFDYLKNNDFPDNTYVIITSDHGEELWDHGDYGHGGGFINRVDAKRYPRNIKVYEESIHVPLIIFGPNIEGKIIDKPVSNIDIMPTILDLLGIIPPKKIDGRSLTHFLRNNSDNTEDEYPIIAEAIDPWGPFAYANHPMRSELYSYRIGMWKYIHYTDKKRMDELYNLIEDSKEKINLIDSHPDVAKKLRSKIQDHIDSKTQIDGNSLLKNKIKKIKIANL